MNMSFYTGATGARQFTKKLSVTANNLANINTRGYKPKTAAFSQLVQYNLNDSETAQTQLQERGWLLSHYGQRKAGAGSEPGASEAGGYGCGKASAGNGRGV